MDSARALLALDAERRRVPPGGSGIKLPHVARVSGEQGAWHGVAWSSFEKAEAYRHITEEIEYHRSLGVEFEWKVYAHDQPAELLDLLRARGFNVGPREAVMVLDLNEQHSWLEEDFRVTVRRVGTSEQLRVYQDLTDRAFGRPRGLGFDACSRELLQALERGAKEHTAFLVYLGDEAVCGGRLHTHPGGQFGGLYGGGTLQQYRGKGLYRALVAARAREARELGLRYLQVDALPTSEPILCRLGFEQITATWPCHFPPQGSEPYPAR